jgi:nitric oxide reductase subunit B
LTYDNRVTRQWATADFCAAIGEICQIRVESSLGRITHLLRNFADAVLGWVGSEIFRQMPPIPREVAITDGKVLIADGEVSDGQNVWQSMGGMQVGSIWGHGSYVAPDWTADYLHREALYILDSWEKAGFARGYDALSSEQQAVLRQRLQDRLSKNTYDAQTGRITIEPIRAQAFEENLRHYADIFTNGNQSYAIQRNAQPDPAKLWKSCSIPLF